MGRPCLQTAPWLALVLAICGPAAAGDSGIVRAAQAQVGVTLRYDPAYRALKTYFQRAGYQVKPTREAGNYLPGDVVAWDLGRGVLHIGIVSDQKTVDGSPLVVHNIGSGAREEDILFRYTIIGQFRLPPPRGP